MLPLLFYSSFVGCSMSCSLLSCHIVSDHVLHAIQVHADMDDTIENQMHSLFGMLIIILTIGKLVALVCVSFMFVSIIKRGFKISDRKLYLLDGLCSEIFTLRIIV